MTSPLARATTPAARIASLVLLVTAIATAPLEPGALLTGAAVAIAIAILARPPWRQLALRALVAAGVVVALLVPLLLIGDQLRAGALTARAVTAVTIALCIGSTLAPGELPAALDALWVPRSLTAIIDTMLRQLGGIRAEGSRLVLARRLRGARGLAVGPEVIATLLAKSAGRAERVELAMRLRGYDPVVARRHAALTSGDALPLAVALAAAVAIHLSPRLS